MQGDGVVMCLVNGPWQALSMVASLAELGFSRAPERLVTLLVDMEEGSAIHSAARRILRANGLPEPHTIPGSLAPRRLPGQLARVSAAARFAPDQVTSIVSYGVHRPIARYLAHQAPRAKLLIYEEGLRAYVPRNTALRERLRLAGAQLWGQVDREFGTAWKAVPSTREIAYCLLLGERLTLPAQLHGAELHHIPKQRLVSALAALEPARVRAKPAAPFVLIVGQYYAQLKQMSQRTELEAYSAAARAIARRGQVPVWRGHIRREDAFLGPLQAACPELCSFSELVEDPSLPLELYADLLAEGCAGAVSFSSSALFYLNYVHGIETHTLLSEALIERMNHPHREACALAHAHLPRFAASLSS